MATDDGMIPSDEWEDWEDIYDCNHKEYEKKTIMDFSFYVCENCGHQWKA